MRTTQWAAALRVARAVDFANRADVPLAVDTNMAKVVAFKTRLVVAGMIAGKWGINWHAMNGSGGVHFMVKFSALEG